MKDFLVSFLSRISFYCFPGNKSNIAGLTEKKKEEIQRISQEMKKGQAINPNAIVITRSDLLRMKVNSHTK